MRSSRENIHISGAERLLDFDQLEEAMSEMIQRALVHPRGRAAKICLTLETVASQQVRRAPLLSLSTLQVKSWQEGRQRAVDLLIALGLERQIVENAIAQLAAGPAPQSGVMRGAMLIDATTGQRLEPDQARGVRVSRMDIEPQAQKEVRQFLPAQGLASQRITEAWVLASKVALAPQVIAELCWSDDPDYLTGYLASRQNGYQRITHLKKAGSPIGGRIFFIRSRDNLPALIDFLQNSPILFYPPEVQGV